MKALQCIKKSKISFHTFHILHTCDNLMMAMREICYADEGDQGLNEGDSAASIQVHFTLDFIMEANNMNPDQTAPIGAV